MIQTLALAVAMGVATSSFAFADDYLWSGIYAGVHAGWGAGTVNWVDYSNGWFTDAANPAHSAKGDGVLGGGHIGVLHHHANNLVTGVELAASGLDANTSVASAIYTDHTLQTDIDMVATATARLGYSLGRFLPYVEAGYAGGNIHMRNFDTNWCAPVLCVFDSKRWHNGFVFGAGTDIRVTGNIIAGLNYRFINLDADDHQGINQNLGVDEHFGADAQVHSATFRLSWLFNSN
ncbi:MAG: outer membrane protein [Rhizobiaceae bacterium]